ncbi:MAG: hypothetical protein CMJ52_05720 [Planctomycetaceae bacterium]|nr:hypothetical protein [Planctomycetaceae bacterium]
MPSVREIAEIANVSIGTVSRVLNNRPHVSEKSRAKVLKAANAIRDDLVAGSRKTATAIALVYRGESSLYSEFDAAILHGVVTELEQTHHDLVLINAGRRRESGESLAQMLLRRGVAGALLRTTSSTRDMCRELADARFPTVLIADEFDSPYVGSVRASAASAIERGLNHLVHLGHRKIAIGLNEVDDFDHAERLAVYRRVLHAAGISIEPQWVVRGPAYTSSGGATLRQVMSLPDRPTAIFVTDPALGEGLAVEALRMGVRIPRDLSVVGFDDSNRRFTTFPRISSICQNTDLLGRTAIQHLLDIITKTTEPRRLRLECGFEPLDSTAPPMEQG